MGINNKKKKEIALQLYLTGENTLKEIAEMVEANPKTIAKWAKDDNWESIKAADSLSTQQQVARMKEQVKELNAAIAARDKGQRVATVEEAEILRKLSAAIRQLSNDSDIVSSVEVGKKFIAFVKSKDLEMAKDVVEMWNEYVKTLL